MKINVCVYILFACLWTTKCSCQENKQFFFISSSANIRNVSFEQTVLIGVDTVMSLLGCCINCAVTGKCNSLSYDAKQCSMYTTNPLDTSISSLSYLLFPPWCDVYAGFIYMRAINLCFKTFPTSVGCDDGRLLCLQNNASIVEVNSKERQTFINAVITNEKNMHGTFLAGKRVNGIWVRSNGLSFNYTNWDTRDPNYIQPSVIEKAGECIGIDVNYQYLWHDYENIFRFGIICEQVYQT